MKPTLRPRIKICCISTRQELEIAVGLGVDALGLVARMPRGPGIIPDDLVRELARRTPPSVASFLLTSETTTQAIIAHQCRTGADTLQIVDALSDGTYKDLRTALPGISLVQVIHVNGSEAFDEAKRVAPHVDGILLDSGNPKLPVKELGGTGRVHNWDISRRIREALDIPVFLAGGLNAENVREAIETVRPFGVDVCSGVRSDGQLDSQKLHRFVEVVRQYMP
ncbi:phosphoribosylanthranilate isomerase [Hymenobacter aerilatus]|uniref:N-(5'-phosphoribosyl)anthranilate isomerase n=1 Tax=Hymenobacter aerilatus TaxID=2932251 RepID=A0A8T9STQ0_9BACT|nr:phosphoribosylanthranilate isomerase [Hymenobacter aerilatus]UOR04711.1 phosphoribosylanthranilate isomerase [Hymenobacter aerilatus]